jgi:apolipoprotein N-acyltransferase
MTIEIIAEHRKSPTGPPGRRVRQSRPDMFGPRPRLPKWSKLMAAGIACGLLIALSEPPFGWWPLAWAAFAGVAFLVSGREMGERAAAGFAVGVGQFVLGIWWVQEFSIPGYLALVIVSSLFITVALAVVPARRRRGVILALPVVFLLAEWLRDRFPLGGFPLGSGALGQAVSPLAPSLRLGGSLLLTAETVLVGVVVFEAVQVGRRWFAPRSMPPLQTSKVRSLKWEAGVLLGLAGLVVAVPVAGTLSPSGAGGSLTPVRVALVQGGGPRGTRAISTDPQVVFARHLQASAALQPPLDLVVWPEGILQSNTDYTATPGAAAVSTLAERLRATVLVGVEQDVAPDRYLNMVVAWNPSGDVVASYEKNHLVPFGEYVPWRSALSKVFNFNAVPYDGIPGHGPGIIRTPAGPLGVMISYEVFFDQRARGAVQAGGQILVVPTNTASYRSSQVPAEELAAARLRARETGRWLLQVTPTGYSAVVSPEGRVVSRTTLGRQQIVYATVPRRTGRTVYVDIGDAPLAVAAGLVLIVSYLLVRPEFRRIRARQLSR